MAGKFKDYVLGSGELHWALSLTQGAPPLASAAYRYLGNTPELSQAQSSTKLDHFDADHGLKQKDDSIILQLDRTGKFKADSMDVANLALFFLADSTTFSQSAATAVAEPLTVSPGTGVQLGTTINPSGLRDISNLVVNLTDTPATVYTAGSDYLLDAETGWVKFPEGTTIPADTGITATFDAAAGTRVQVVSSQNALLEGSLKFLSNNPKGTKRDFLWPYVQLTPDGDFVMKGDTWQEMNFNFDVLTPGDGRAAMYIDGRPNAI
jgi:hypothetical protein